MLGAWALVLGGRQEAQRGSSKPAGRRAASPGLRGRRECRAADGGGGCNARRRGRRWGLLGGSCRPCGHRPAQRGRDGPARGLFDRLLQRLRTRRRRRAALRGSMLMARRSVTSGGSCLDVARCSGIEARFHCDIAPARHLGFGAAAASSASMAAGAMRSTGRKAQVRRGAEDDVEHRVAFGRASSSSGRARCATCRRRQTWRSCRSCADFSGSDLGQRHLAQAHGDPEQRQRRGRQ